MPSNMSLMVRDTEVATPLCTMNLWFCSLLSSSSPANKVVYCWISQEIAARTFFMDSADAAWAAMLVGVTAVSLVACGSRLEFGQMSAPTPHSQAESRCEFMDSIHINIQPLFSFIFRNHEGPFNTPPFQCLDRCIRLRPLHKNFHNRLLGRRSYQCCPSAR